MSVSAIVAVPDVMRSGGTISGASCAVASGALAMGVAPARGRSASPPCGGSAGKPFRISAA